MPKITEMFAFVATDAGPDDEGVMAMWTPGGWMPMVGADIARAVSLRPIADQIAKESGVPYKCLHFKLDGELPLTEG